MSLLFRTAVALTGLTFGGLTGAAAAAAQPSPYFFQSPSGNIACYAEPETIRCDIQDRDWSPPARPADCPSQTGYGQGIILGSTGKAKFVCGGDTTFGADATTLGYGQRESSVGWQCDSEESGIRCVNRDDHGFNIARESYDLF